MKEMQQYYNDILIKYLAMMKKIIIEEPPVPFQWMPIPEYLKNYYLPDGSNFYDTFNKWYTMYCINGENLDRKKEKEEEKNKEDKTEDNNGMDTDKEPDGSEI